MMQQQISEGRRRTAAGGDPAVTRGMLKRKLFPQGMVSSNGPIA
jgi:hypothetical protein